MGDEGIGDQTPWEMGAGVLAVVAPWLLGTVAQVARGGTGTLLAPGGDRGGCFFLANATSKLRKSVSDPARLRTLTGDWFCDVRAQRHRHHLGSDLVRASIRRRRRPRGRQGWGLGGEDNRGGTAMAL